MPDVSLNGIEFTIKGSSDAASDSIDKLTQRLGSLKTALSGIASVSNIKGAFSDLANGVKTMNDAMKGGTSKYEKFAEAMTKVANSVNTIGSGGESLTTLANAMKTMEGVKVTATAFNNLASGVEKVADAASKITAEAIANLEKMVDALSKLSGVDLKGLGSAMNAVRNGGAKALAATPLPDDMRDLISNASQIEVLEAKLDSLRASMQQAFDAGDADKAYNFRAQIIQTEAALERARAAAKRTSEGIKDIGKESKKASGPLANFANSIKRIAMYRAIRSIIKSITEAIKEGAENFYNFTKQSGGSFANYAKALDGVRAASSQMKNQLGAAWGTLYTMIAPIITNLISLVTKLANALTMIFARISGASGWYRATEGAADAINDVGGAAKEAMKYLAPFDELNRLPSNNGGGGGGGDGGNGGGYEWVDFEQFDIGDGLASIAQWYTDVFNSAAEWIEDVDWLHLASNIVTEITNAFSKVDWAGLTQSVARFLGAALGAVSGFLVGALADLVTSISDGIYNAFHNDDGTAKTGEEIWNGICEGIKNAVVGVYTWVKDNIVTPFIDGFKKAFGIASPAKEMEGPGEMVGQGILEGIAAPFKAIGEWLDEHIVQPIKDFFAGDIDFTLPFSLNIADGFEEKLKGIKDLWDKIKTRSPKLTPIIKGWSTSKQKVLDKLKTGWDHIKEKTSTLTAGLKDNVNHSLLDKLKEGWNAIKDKAATFTASLKGNTVVQKFIDAWNGLKNKTLELKVSIADKIKTAWNAAAKAWNSSALLSKLGTLPYLAKGGMLNAGQIFVARESGPEIVGQYGSKAGVMNNEQIVRSVSEGVARAVAAIQFSVSAPAQATYVNNEANEETLYRAMLRALNDADMDVEVNLDGDPVYRSMVNRNRKETFRTGVNPLMSRA